MALDHREYQIELCERVATKFREGAPSVLMQLGTGGGKTATCSILLERAVRRGYRCAFFAHLDSLIEDTHARLVAAGLRAGFIQAGRPTDPDAPVQVCSLQTLTARGELPPSNFIVLDEAHRAQGPTVRAILEAYPEAALLGLTATPQRGDRKPLGDVFAEMVCGPSNRWLTENGFLVPADIIAPDHYIDGALGADPVRMQRRHAHELRTIVFASNKEHARRLAIAYRAAGYSADVMFGDTGRDKRVELRRRIASGKLQILIGVNVFIEGFDVPEIECVSLLRDFGVTSAYLQGIGRGVRIAPWIGKKRCVVLDPRGLVWNHGLPDEDRIWSLTGRAVRRAETLAALMRCKECLAIFRPSSTCPRCGMRMGLGTSVKIPRVLTREEKMTNVSALPQEERDWRYVQKLVTVATKRMRMTQVEAERWAARKFREQFNRKPGEAA